MTAHTGGSDRRRMRELLTLETSDPRIGEAFAEARLRLLDVAHGARAPAASVMPALAALSLGDADPAAALLTHWVAQADGSEEIGEVDFAGAAAGGSSLVPVLAARYHAWTGDSALIRDIWTRIRRACAHAWESAVPGRSTRAEVVLVALLLHEAAAMAEAAGATAAAAEVASQSRSLLQDLRLNRYPPGDDSAVPLAAALGAFEADPALVHRLAPDLSTLHMSLSDLALWAWAALTLGDQAAAPRAWQRLLLGPADERNTLSDASLHSVPDQSVAIVLAGAVFGLIGASPDAAKLRLRLRPQLPEFWNALVVRNLAMGDARFDLSIQRRGERREYRVDQTGGAYPASLILEIPVPGAAVRSIEVDGRPASLDIRPFGPGFLIPVQLVMDNERAVVVEGEGY